MTHNAKVGIGAVAVIVVFAVILAAVGHGTRSTDTLSPEAKAYLDKAMPALAQVTSEIQAGDNAQAALDWQAIGVIPVSNDADRYVASKYAAYMNDVRYYGVGDGSVNLRQLEDSQTTAEQTIAAFQ